MWISDFAIRQPVVTIVLMLALVVFGTFSLFLLETDEFPEIEPPVVTLTVPYPGASPEVVEREVVTPLEDAFTAISGVDEITSTSVDGFAIIIIEFVYEKDLQEASQDVRDRISELRQELPLEMEEPVLTRFDPNDLPIVSLVLTSDRLSPAELTLLADPAISSELQSVPGVAEVQIVGGVEPEISVRLDPEALRAAGVGVNQVVAALQAANLAVPVGQVESPVEQRAIRLEGRIEEPEGFADVALKTTAGRLVRLGQVAQVSAEPEEPTTLALFQGEPAVGIDVVKTTESSTTTVAEEVLARVEELRATLPAGVQLEVVRNSGERVARSVEDVQRTLLEGAVLTVLVVFVFLASWRSTVITGLALPVSVLASFIAVLVFGYTLNTMSLLGLSLAIGILIDDAIVVRENIVRHMEMGKDHVTAAHEGTAEIGLAVAATTFSIVVVFVPIAFMGGIAEQFFAPLALTIAASVLVSLLVSFSLDPMLSAYWPEPHVEPGQEGPVRRLLLRFDRWLERQTLRYQRVIRWALHHRVAMVALALGSFVAALALPAAGLVGTSFFPVEDRSEFNMLLETPPGSSLDYTAAKAATASRVAQAVTGVAYTYATVGGTQGISDEATLYVRLVPKADRDLHQDAIAAAVRERMNRIAGVTAAISSGGMGGGKEIQLQLQGPDAAVLAELADRLALAVTRAEGAVDVGLSTRGQRPDFEVRVRRGFASTLGLTVEAVGVALRAAFAGIDVGDWVDPLGETRDVRVRLEPTARAHLGDVLGLPLAVTDDSGQVVTLPLTQVAEVIPGYGPAQIQHLNRQRVIRVEANTEDLPLSEVMANIEREIAEVELPPGYRIVQGGDVESQNEVFGRTLAALAVAVLLMYLILVLQFGSFLDPLPILASLPLSLIGVMLALWLTGSTLNLMSMIGIVLLMGIVAKNAILLVDFAKWSHEGGTPWKQALEEAGRTRLRPILMTSVAIVAGMVPVALGFGEGADARAPLGRAVIGGVITSTILTLLVIPTFYDMLAEVRDRAMGALRRRMGRAPEATRE